MRIISVLFLLLFLQACVHSGDLQNTPFLFPFEKNGLQNDKNPGMEISENGMRTFAYLGLYEAIKRDDYDKIKLYSDKIVEENPEPLFLAEAVTWFYNKGYMQEAKALLEKCLQAMPDELPFILMYAELLQTMQEVNSDLSPALDLLKAYIGNHPQDYNAYIELGVIYYKLFQYENAYFSFMQIPEKEKTSSVYVYIGICLEKMKRYDDAKKYFSRVLREFPEEKSALQHLGMIAEVQRNYALARKYYSRLLELDNSNYDYLLRLISIAFKEGNHQRAFNIAKEHFNFDFIVSVSSMLIQEGRLDLAEELLNNLGTMENAPRELLYLHGALIYEADKDKKRALPYLLQLREDEEHYKNAQEIITYIHLDNNEFDEALLHIKKLQLLSPDTKNYKVLEYQVYLFQEQYEQAYEALYEFLQEYPEDNRAKFRFAYTCFHLNEKEKAMRIMKEILLAEPDNYDALNFVGYTLVEQNKDLKQAEEYLLKADRLNPNHGYINDSLAWLYYKKGDYAKALEFIEKAISYSKNTTKEDATMWEHYGDISQKLGNVDTARSAYEKSLKIEKNSDVELKLNKLY